MRDHVRVTNLVHTDQPGGNDNPAERKSRPEMSGSDERRERRSLERQAARDKQKAAKAENASEAVSRPPASGNQGRRQPPGSVWIDE